MPTHPTLSRSTLSPDLLARRHSPWRRPAFAPVEPFVVKDIRVEGVQRTEAGTVFSYLPVKVGDA